MKLGTAVPIAVVAVLLASCARQTAVQVPPDYRSWKRTTDETLDYPIPGHMDRLRRIYINAVGETVTVSEEAGRTVWDYPPEASPCRGFPVLRSRWILKITW